jgi:hypothetical protein
MPSLSIQFDVNEKQKAAGVEVTPTALQTGYAHGRERADSNASLRDGPGHAIDFFLSGEIDPIKKLHHGDAASSI